MLKENDVVGAIVIYGKEARYFTDKQVVLLENFAAQAVIAIENARLRATRGFTAADSNVRCPGGHFYVAQRPSSGISDDAGERHSTL